MIRAAVFVPLGVSDEERYATEGLECVKHRGYEYAGTYRQTHYVDKLLRDPARPTYLATRYDSGDGLHPNAAGYRLIGQSIPLASLRR